jgi:L-alanine-DL-glutamate epimerase-like enolase superfamily enzyme
VSASVPIRQIRASAYRIPTETPEADGTLEWSSTTLVLVQIEAGGQTGLGYTYESSAAVAVISEQLTRVLCGHDVHDIPGAHLAMQRQVRNIGRSGVAACAISAVDAALWDLKAKLLSLPLAKLLGMARFSVPVYGSGGFTNYDDDKLAAQLSGWVEHEGCRWVKMKIGADPTRDLARIKAARAAIGNTPLFIDANGALTCKSALELARSAAAEDVHWFEEPVSSDDLRGLRFIREHAPARIDVAAGEYSYNLDDVRRMLETGSVDVQQVDASRCCGITGFLSAGALCEAFHIDLSGHCAPSLHLHAACAVPRLRHLEYFFDHVRIEHMLFDGAARARNGVIAPDLTRPGLGLEFKEADACRYAIQGN